MKESYQYIIELLWWEGYINSHGYTREDIYLFLDDYYQQVSHWQSNMFTIQQSLSALPLVRWIKTRIKSPYRIIQKILKRQIPLGEYRNHMADIIWLRVLYLIHDDRETLLQQIYSLYWTSFIKKKIFLQKHDDQSLSTRKQQGYNIEFKDNGYHNCVHYQCKQHDLLFEIQVRDIFLEAWSELDHFVSYSRHNPALPHMKQLLLWFRNMMSAAQDMAQAIVQQQSMWLPTDQDQASTIQAENLYQHTSISEYDTILVVFDYMKSIWYNVQKAPEPFILAIKHILGLW